MRRLIAALWILGLCTPFIISVAQAHAIAGMRVFPGTLTFSDPGVTDELDLNYSHASLAPFPGTPAVSDSQFSLNYSKTITGK